MGRSPRFLNQTRKYIAANVRQAEAIIDHTTVTQLSVIAVPHPAIAGITTIPVERRCGRRGAR